MGDSLSVHVGEGVDELLVVVASLTFRQTSAEGNKVEEFTTSDELEGDVSDLFASLLGVHLHAFVDFDESHDVDVIELSEGTNFGVDKLLEGLLRMDDLDGVSSAGVVLGELDLAGDSASESSAEDVLVKSGGHSSLDFDSFVYCYIIEFLGPFKHLKVFIAISGQLSSIDS